MAILTKAGLVDAVKQGQWRWYRRNEKALRRLGKSLRAQCERELSLMFAGQEPSSLASLGMTLGLIQPGVDSAAKER